MSQGESGAEAARRVVEEWEIANKRPGERPRLEHEEFDDLIARLAPIFERAQAGYLPLLPPRLPHVPDDDVDERDTLRAERDAAVAAAAFTKEYAIATDCLEHGCAHTRCDALRERAERAESDHAMAADMADMYKGQRDAAEADVARLRGFAKHDNYCLVVLCWNERDATCDCGLAEVLIATRPPARREGGEDK